MFIRVNFGDSDNIRVSRYLCLQKEVEVNLEGHVIWPRHEHWHPEVQRRQPQPRRVFLLEWDQSLVGVGHIYEHCHHHRRHCHRSRHFYFGSRKKDDYSFGKRKKKKRNVTAGNMEIVVGLLSLLLLGLAVVVGSDKKRVDRKYPSVPVCFDNYVFP